MDSPPPPVFNTIPGLLSVHVCINLKQTDKTNVTHEIPLSCIHKHTHFHSRRSTRRCYRVVQCTKVSDTTGIW